MNDRLTLAALAMATVVAGCASPMYGGGAMSGGPTATVRLEATRGNTATGMAEFHQHREAVMVHVKVEGLKPGQEHGFHVHAMGDCSSGDGVSAGGHFNPAGKPHGRYDADERHAGDLPALKADAQGRAEARFPVTGITVGSGAADDIVGKGLIVHAQPDDYQTQPTGNAGARLACGVIARRP